MAWLQWWDTNRASCAVPARLLLLAKLSAHEPGPGGGTAQEPSRSERKYVASSLAPWT